MRWPTLCGPSHSEFHSSSVLRVYYACIPYTTLLLSTHSSCSRSQRKHTPHPNPKFPPKFPTHVLMRTTRPILWVDRVHGAPAPCRPAPSTLRLLLYVIQRWAAWSLLFSRDVLVRAASVGLWTVRLPWDVDEMLATLSSSATETTVNFAPDDSDLLDFSLPAAAHKELPKLSLIHI